MKFYYDRNNALMQIVPEYRNLSDFVQLKVYLGPVSPIDNESECVKLWEGSPLTLIPVTKTFSNHTTGNLYIVGIAASGIKKEIGSTSITGNNHFNDFYDNMTRGLKIRKDWYSKLRSERAIIYFKQSTGTCVCYDQNFNNSNPDCPTCKGTGESKGYIGSSYNVMVGNDYKKVKVRDPNGKSVKVEALEAWIFEFPFVNDECILQRQNGDRFFINNVTYKHLGGNLIEEAFNLVLMPDSFEFTYNLT